MLFGRHGQSAVRGPHAALQLIFAARQPFFIIKNLKLHKYYRPKGIKNDKMWKQSSNVKNLRPGMKNIFKIWPASKKVWPPLLYGMGLCFCNNRVEVKKTLNSKI
jgi:hypothetical protein